MIEKKSLSGYHLKLIALITMAIDHIAAVVIWRVYEASYSITASMQLSDKLADKIIVWVAQNQEVVYNVYEMMRYIGRMAFPIYCFLLVEGFLHTRNVAKYAGRLAVFALISEIPFDLALTGEVLEFGHQNVFFTLFLGLLMLYLMTKAPDEVRGLLCVFAILFISRYLRIDYSYRGLLMIFWYYQYRNNNPMKLFGIAFINVFIMGGAQIFALLALIPILLHNGEQGPKCKGFFYGFYPVHLLAIYLVKMIM